MIQAGATVSVAGSGSGMGSARSDWRSTTRLTCNAGSSGATRCVGPLEVLVVFLVVVMNEVYSEVAA